MNKPTGVSARGLFHAVPGPSRKHFSSAGCSGPFDASRSGAKASVGRPSLPIQASSASFGASPQPGASAAGPSGLGGLPPPASPAGDTGNRLVVIALLLVLAGAGIGALAFLLQRPDMR